MNFYQRKFIEPLKKFLKQGASPKRLAVSIAIGVTLGIFPIYGITTSVITILAFMFGLNLIVMQIPHYLIMPVQFVLIPIFFKFGQTMFHKELIPMSFTQIKLMMKTDLWSFLGNFGEASIYAIIAWGIIAIPLFFGIYFITLPWLNKMVRTYRIKKIRESRMNSNM